MLNAQSCNFNNFCTIYVEILILNDFFSQPFSFYIHFLFNMYTTLYILNIYAKYLFSNLNNIVHIINYTPHLLNITME